MSDALTDIPLIDVGPFLDGSDVTTVADQVDAACRSAGFFVIVGHGVDTDLLDRCRGAAGQFFGQALDDKLPVGGDSYAGYMPPRSEAVAYSLGHRTPPDLKESLTFDQEAVPGDPYYESAEAALYFQPNRWPTSPVGLREATEKLFATFSALADDIMRIFAVALGLPASYFDPLMDKPFSYLRYVNYPALGAPPEPGQLRAGAHTDYGSLTFVVLDGSEGGLQVADGAGGWIDVPRVPGGIVVNIGDLMARWTNDRWHSTLHRVALPAGVDAGSERLSIVFFHEPNYDVVVEPLPGCVSEAHPALHVTTTVGAHLAEKMGRQADLVR